MAATAGPAVPTAPPAGLAGLAGPGRPQVRVQRPVYEQAELERAFGFGRRQREGKPARWSAARLGPWLGRCLPARVPPLTWLRHYDWRRDLPGDLAAGATVAVMHVPQGMAYAMLGGVPPITGIHMAFYPVLLYALLGTSRHISVGTFAVVCLMTGSAVAEHADSYSPLQVASAVSFMVGVYLLLMSVFRLGALSSLLSDPLVSGFSVGAAFHAFTSQIKDVMGVRLPRRRGLFNVPLAYYDLVQAAPDANVTALVVSAVAIAVLAVFNEVIKPWASKRCSLPVPIELIVVVTASLVGRLTVVFADLRTVGDIPTGLQAPQLPPLELLPLVAVHALTVAVVAYVIAMSLALLFAARERYEVDGNQELLALGAASLFGSLFACIPVSASPSRSSLQMAVGGRTQLASVFSCLGLLVVLLWAGPFFEPLPRCVLASVILVALKPMLMQARDVARFWRMSRVDGALWALTFLSTVLLDLDVALAAGVAAQLAALLLQGAAPHTCELRPLQAADGANTGIYVDAERYAHTAPLKGIQILQFCGALNFATQGALKTAVRRLGRRPGAALTVAGETHTLVLDLAAVPSVDPAAVAALRGLHRELALRGVALLLAGCNARVLAGLRRCWGLLDAVSLPAFPTTHDAVLHAQSVALAASPLALL